jgi:glyoxylate/hydroxypyruvate reductase
MDSQKIYFERGAAAAMNIALYVPGGNVAPWQTALAPMLPNARWVDWRDNANICDYAIAWAPPPELFTQQRALKAVFSLGAGADHLLRVPTLPSDVPVIRVEDAGMAAQMAHYALWAVTRYVYGFDALHTTQQQGRWAHALHTHARQVTIGVFGLGALGAHVARVLATAGFSVQGYSQSAKQIAGVACYHGAALDAFVQSTHILILLAPHTPCTHQVVNAQLLQQLPKPAYLINMARGALVDDAALLAALDADTITGATLDVFNTEPLPQGHAYWQHPKVTITPHCAAKTVIEPTAAQIAGKILALQAGQAVTGVVDRSRGY